MTGAGGAVVTDAELIVEPVDESSVVVMGVGTGAGEMTCATTGEGLGSGESWIRGSVGGAESRGLTGWETSLEGSP